ncbi:MAG: hypothetical protein HYX60_11520 [Legionella longbeachae]|nr:hypothetical protein [Legionella longbeachae]
MINKLSSCLITLQGIDHTYETATNTTGVLNAVRVEQGEYAVLLNSLEKYDTGTFEEDIQGWSIDPGNVILSAEIRIAFNLIKNEVEKQRILMFNKLRVHINEITLCNKLISIVPIFVGWGADNLNDKIVEFLINLSTNNLYETNQAAMLNQVRLEFNKSSQYPLMKEIIPIISALYNIDEKYLYTNLHHFSEVDFLSYGVDVSSKTLASILNQAQIETNPCLNTIEILKLESQKNIFSNSSDLIDSLCTISLTKYIR